MSLKAIFPRSVCSTKVTARHFSPFIRPFSIDLTINLSTALLAIIGIDTLHSKRSVRSSILYWASYCITKVCLSQHYLSFGHFSSLDLIFHLFYKDVLKFCTRKGNLIQNKNEILALTSVSLTDNFNSLL